MEILSFKSQKYEYIYTAQDIELIFFKEFEYGRSDIPDTDDYLYHTHEWYEMFFVEKGNLTLYVEGNAYLLHAGDFMIIKPGTVHFSEITEFTSNCYAFPVQFACRYVNAAQNKKLPWKHLLDTAPYVLLTGNKELISLALFLKNAIITEHKPSIGSYLYTLLTRMEYFQTDKDKNRNNDIALYDSNAGRIYKIDQLLQIYFATDISLSSVANELHISRRQLSRIIRQQYGCSFREKIISLRIKQAKALLAQGYSTLETAHKVGYSSVEAFRTAFIKQLGITPAEYRRQNICNL